MKRATRYFGRCRKARQRPRSGGAPRSAKKRRREKEGRQCYEEAQLVSGSASIYQPGMGQPYTSRRAGRQDGDRQVRDGWREGQGFRPGHHRRQGRDPGHLRLHPRGEHRTETRLRHLPRPISPATSPSIPTPATWPSGTSTTIRPLPILATPATLAATLGGLGTSGITIEMGALYYPTDDSSPNAPLNQGTLFKLTLSEQAKLTVKLNEARGGIVLTNPDVPAVVDLSGATSIAIASSPALPRSEPLGLRRMGRGREARLLDLPPAVPRRRRRPQRRQRQDRLLLRRSQRPEHPDRGLAGQRAAVRPGHCDHRERHLR